MVLYRGLLGGHVVASFLKKKRKGMLWYNNELRDMAREVGMRLLPAFNTTTGIPYPKVGLAFILPYAVFRAKFGILFKSLQLVENES